MLHRRTPLIPSLPLGAHLNTQVLLKLENTQPSGSFKDRGIGRLCTQKAKAGAQMFVSSSGGNAGMSVAYAGRCLRVSVQVVVPLSTPQMMRERLAAAGAQVQVHGATWDDADQVARQLAAAPDAAYISPFDHRLIWEGHSTLVDELVAETSKPAAIVLSVGGGGLLAGVVQGLQRVGWQDVPVYAVETEGAASLAASLAANKPVSLASINTIASSLGARQVAQEAFDCAGRHPVTSVVVTDAAAVNACVRFADDHRTLVEPACGAALSLAYDPVSALRTPGAVVFIVCGGNGVTLGLLAGWEKKFAITRPPGPP